MTNTWAPIKGYEGLYRVNQAGQVLSLPRSYVDRWGNKRSTKTRLLKPTYRPQYGGRYVYGLTDSKGTLKQHYLHILVAETFNRKTDFRNLDGEIWKPINWMDHYEVSNKGRVRSDRRTYDVQNMSFCDYRLIQLDDNGSGYQFVKTPKHRAYVHRLVAEAFVPNRERLSQVDHLDGNKKNNSAVNLEWVTGLENVRRAIRNGQISSGIGSPRGIFDESDLKRIKALYSKGVSQTEIAKTLGTSLSNVNNVLRGVNYVEDYGKV